MMVSDIAAVLTENMFFTARQLNNVSALTTTDDPPEYTLVVYVSVLMLYSVIASVLLDVVGANIVSS